MQDKYCLQSLQIHWNSEWFGGFSVILTGKELNYTDTDDFNTVLRLSHIDLIQIRSTSMEYCINKCLKVVHNATSHQDVVDSFIKLTG